MVCAAWTRGDWLGLAGIVVSALGFVFAWSQLHRTANAAEATRDALIAANRVQLLMLLPQFRLIEMELDFAVGEEKRELATRALANYAHLAHEVSAVVAAFTLANEDLVMQLRTSASLATRTKDRIYALPDQRLASLVRPFSTALSTVSASVAELKTKASVVASQG